MLRLCKRTSRRSFASAPRIRNPQIPNAWTCPLCLQASAKRETKSFLLLTSYGSTSHPLLQSQLRLIPKISHLRPRRLRLCRFLPISRHSLRYPTPQIRKHNSFKLSHTSCAHSSRSCGSIAPSSSRIQPRAHPRPLRQRLESRMLR